MAESRAARLARNEALYREVNEHIDELNRSFGSAPDTMTIICECGDDLCATQLDVDVATYERIRSDSLLFMVVPGHELPEVEDVVEEHSAFKVVRKSLPTGQEIARELDRRS